MVKYKEVKKVDGKFVTNEIDPKEYHKNLNQILRVIEKLESEVGIPVEIVLYDLSTSIPPKSAFGWRRTIDGKIVGEIQVSKDSLDAYSTRELILKIAHEFGHLYTLPSDQTWARILSNLGENSKLAGPLKEYVADLFVIEKLPSILGVQRNEIINEYLNWRKSYTDKDYVISSELIKRRFNFGYNETKYEDIIKKIQEIVVELPSRGGFIQIIQKLKAPVYEQKIYEDPDGKKVLNLRDWARNIGEKLKEIGIQKNSKGLADAANALIDLSECKPPLLYSYAQSCIDMFGEVKENVIFNPEIQSVLPKESLDTLSEYLISYRRYLSKISDIYNKTHGKFNSLIMRIIGEEGAGIHKPRLAIWLSEDSKMASYGLVTKVKTGVNELTNAEVININLNQFYMRSPGAVECLFAHELTHVHEFENQISYNMWKNANNTVYNFFMSSFEDISKYISSINSEFFDVFQEVKSANIHDPKVIGEIDELQKETTNDILKLSKLSLKDYAGFLYDRNDSFWEYLKKNEIDINSKISMLWQHVLLLRGKIPDEKFEELNSKMMKVYNTAAMYDEYVFKKFKTNAAPILRTFESFAEFFAQYYAFSYGLADAYENEVTTTYHWMVPEVWEALKRDPTIFKTFFSGKIEDSTLFKEISKIRTDMGFVSALPALEIPQPIIESYVKNRIWEANDKVDRIFCALNGSAMSLTFASMLGRDSELGNHLITISRYEDLLGKLITTYYSKAIPLEVQNSLINEAKNFNPKYLINSTKIPEEEKQKYLLGLSSASTIPAAIYYLNNVLFLEKEAIAEKIEIPKEQGIELGEFERKMTEQYFLGRLNDTYSFLYSFDPEFADKLMTQDDYLKRTGNVLNEGISGLSCMPIMSGFETITPTPSTPTVPAQEIAQEIAIPTTITLPLFSNTINILKQVSTKIYHSYTDLISKTKSTCAEDKEIIDLCNEAEKNINEDINEINAILQNPEMVNSFEGIVRIIKILNDSDEGMEKVVEFISEEENIGDIIKPERIAAYDNYSSVLIEILNGIKKYYQNPVDENLSHIINLISALNNAANQVS
jgi:hypothetical protein